MNLERKMARRNKIYVSRNRLVLIGKGLATAIIWLVLAIGIAESNGNTDDTATLVVATAAMVAGTLYIWWVDRVQDWLRHNKKS